MPVQSYSDFDYYQGKFAASESDLSAAVYCNCITVARIPGYNPLVCSDHQYLQGV